MATMGINSCRDRTSEFHQTIRTFQSRMVFELKLNYFKIIIYLNHFRIHQVHLRLIKQNKI